MNVIDSNEYIDKYDFSSLITQADNQQIMDISKSIIDSGHYFKNSPKYQTQENLFARPEPVWLKMRQSFIYSCFMYLGKEVQITNIMSWVFMTSAGDEVNRDTLWHHHHYCSETQGSISGIWYAHIPADVTQPELTGTEFCTSVSGPSDPLNSTYFVTPKDLTWSVYPSKIWHRPGIIDSKEYRFVFAADMTYNL